MEDPDKSQIDGANQQQSVDPDPFGIGFAILSVIFGGAAYLEARRQRQFLERQAKEDFRRVWYDAKRTLIHARRIIEEFATYVSEDTFGGSEFLFGKVRLKVDPERAGQLRRLHANAHVTASHLSDSLDELLAFLDSEY